MPDEKKRDLVKPLTRYQVPSIADDINGELYFGSKCSTPAKAYDTECLVKHSSLFSKCLAPVYRICWVAAGRFAQQGGAPQTAPHADHPLAGPGHAGLIPGQGDQKAIMIATCDCSGYLYFPCNLTRLRENTLYKTIS
jgi:hypothetical protein